MAIEIIEAMSDLDADSDIITIVIEGSEGSFCAGADMEEALSINYDDARIPDETDWVDLIRSSKPIIAAVNGSAIGVGVTMILPFDTIIASEKSKFGMFFIKIGLVPELASSHYLVQRMGFGKASELCLSGRLVNAEEAESTGLIDFLFNEEDMLDEAIKKVKKNCTTKFDESLDLSFQINNKQKKSEINIRTVINLPGGTGKKIKIAVVCEDTKIQEAKDAGAEVIGGDDLVEKIKDGDLNFEKLICTPGMMVKLSKLGKILGPKGLMPNPKLGTVTNEIKKAITEAKSGQVEIRNDKDGNIGLSIGKKSFQDDLLLKNYNAVIDALEKEKSNITIKGDLIKQAFITSSMGVSYKLKLGKVI